MLSSKDKTFKLILLVVILISGSVIFYESLPFLSGFLGACTIYMLVRKHMIYLVERKKIRPSFAAILILIEVIACFLIPIFFSLWLLADRISHISLQPNTIFEFFQNYVSLVEQKTGYNLASSNNIETATSTITLFGRKLLDEISGFIVNSVVLIFVLYFMLLGGKNMESYIYDILPFNSKNKKEVTEATKIMIKSNAIGIPLLAIIQGVVGTIGYFIFKSPDPILFGFLTCSASIIPLVGTAIVWFPLGLYIALTGNVTSGVGILLYGLIVISNVDSVARFWLQKRLADTHPLITIFGVIIGLALFGFWGVIFGPLMLSMFFLCFDLYKRDYIDK